jgi:hypothetical protein
MSKGGRGLIPVTGSAPGQLEPCRHGSIAAILSMSADPDAQLTDAAAWFKREGGPLVSVELESPAELGAEGFKWEIATALACSQLHVNPFEEPDTRIGRERDRRQLLKGWLRAAGYRSVDLE